MHAAGSHTFFISKRLSYLNPHLSQLFTDFQLLRCPQHRETFCSSIAKFHIKKKNYLKSKDCKKKHNSGLNETKINHNPNTP